MQYKREAAMCWSARNDQRLDVLLQKIVILNAEPSDGVLPPKSALCERETKAFERESRK